jgi:predicted nucleic acid-binding protein
MKEVIIVDTGIIVQYLKTGKGVLPEAYEKYEMNISAATYAELLASQTFQDENLEKEVLEFCEKYFSIKDVTAEIALKAADIVRKNGANLAVSLIAATAIVNKVKLLTDDAKTFSGIEGLELMSM